MSEQTNIYIDGELAGTISDLKHDEPWHYGTLVPGEAFKELKKSLEVAPYAKAEAGVRPTPWRGKTRRTRKLGR